MPSLPPTPGQTRIQCIISDDLHRRARLAMALDNLGWADLVTAALAAYLAAQYPQLDKLTK